MIIVGCGIIGASFAYHANLRGIKDISLFSETLPGDKKQATSNTWGWVNGYTSDDKSYADFRLSNLEYWPKLIDNIESSSCTSKGAFVWDLNKLELQQTLIQHQKWGHSIQEMHQIELDKHLPILNTKPEIAIFGENDLAIEGPKITHDLITASGSQIKKAKVSKIICEGNRVIGIESDQGITYSDQVVLTSGLGIPDLLSSIGISFQLNSTVGLLAYTKPLPKLLKHPMTGLDYHVRQDDSGRLVIGGKFDDDASQEINLENAAKKLVQDMSLRLNYNEDMVLDYYTLGKRPLPIDGRPKIGSLKNHLGMKIEGLYIAVMHSGITNAPLAGKLGIEEIITGKRHSLINDFFPQSLAKNDSDPYV